MKTKTLMRPVVVGLTGVVVALFLVACRQDGTVGVTGDQGIEVAAEVRPYYEQYGGARVFGDPITGECEGGESGRLVQYFDNARLEYQGDQPTDGPVIVYPLGEWAYQGRRDDFALPSPESNHYFQDTEAVAQAAFASFYQATNGSEYLGPPISSLEEEAGRLVQYYQNGRLEWRPEDEAGLQVRLSPLGQAYYFQHGVDCVIIARREEARQSVELTAVNVLANVEKPILFEGQRQVVRARILTPDAQPVVGTVMEVSYVDKSGQEVFLASGTTNKTGSVGVSFSPPPAGPGEAVPLRLRVYDKAGDRLLGETLLSFQVWW